MDKNLKDYLAQDFEEAAAQAWLLHNQRPESVNYKHSWLNLPNGQRATDVSYVDVFKQFPWVKDMGYAYHECMMHMNGSPDIHAGNFMQRLDGTVVIIDPVWEGSNPYKDAWEAEQRERDPYHGYDEPDPEVSGPDYVHKWQKARDDQANMEQRRAEAEAGQIAREMDDIPF